MDLAIWCLWLKRRGLGRLRRVLMQNWDPIGVQGIPQARDEYDSYLGRIADRLRTDGTAETVAEVLADIEINWMQMGSDGPTRLRTAQTIVAWYEGEMARLESRSETR